MNTYCVVYMICGTHYRFKCNAKDKKEARKICAEHMGIRYNDIVSIEKED